MPDKLLSAGEVAQLFHVSPKTVTRWADAGLITPYRTLGGHRRYRESELRSLLARQEDRREGAPHQHG